MARQRGVFGGVLAAGVLAPLLMAGGAVAAQGHGVDWTVGCDKVSVRVSGYDSEFTNRVTVEIGGRQVVTAEKFGTGYTKDFPVEAHTEDVVVTLTVTTDQEPKSPIIKTGTSAPCPKPTPTPTPTPSATPTPTPSVTPSATPTPKPTPTPSVTPSKKPSPKPSTPQLAETGGGGSALPIALAGAGVILVGGALVLVGRRRSR
ncbi:LPXTG cell wall anchor domain-containing protein [Kitasatospora sp. NPDC096147]|uniref:LPXTG cell wall anchor domain-containing protein n=1 Tax=Kitasatospora sp. NPDC096147 TaxID=3364093 RepID=UPI003823DCBE